MRYSFIIAFFGFVSIIATILICSEALVYDEPYYFENINLLDQYGFTSEFLINMKGPAGPLHAYIHYCLSVFLDWDNIRLVRMLNPLLSIGIVIGLSRTIKILKPNSTSSGIYLFLIPMSFVSVGLALTEIPAMFMFVGSLYLVAKHIHFPTSGRKYLYFILAGVLFSFSVLGRQPYWVCLAGFIYLFYCNRKSLGFRIISFFMIPALVIPIYVFSVWSGLAPSVGGDIATQNFLSPFHFFLGCGYAAFTMLVICPHYYLPLTKSALLWCVSLFLVLFGVVSFLDLDFNYGMLSIKNMFPESLKLYVSSVLLSGLISIGVIFLAVTIKHMYTHRRNIYFISLGLMLLGLLTSNIAITHLFSNRYVYQAAPLFIIIAAYFYKPSKLSYSMHIVGVVLGLKSLFHFIGVSF